MSKELLTPKEYASRMRLNESAVRRMCARGDIPCKKIGSRWRIQTDAETPEESLEDARALILDEVLGTIASCLGDLQGKLEALRKESRDRQEEDAPHVSQA